MSETASLPADAERFNWLERRGDDFPYYRGRPVEITGGQWWLVMLAVAVGFAVLIYPLPFLRGTVTRFVPAILYFAIPLAALAYVAPTGWTAIFRRLRGWDFLLMVLFGIINIAVTLVTGALIVKFLDSTANQAISGAGTMEGGAQLLLFLRTGLQLFGEEVMSILPFLALLYWLAGRRGMSRKSAIIAATLIVAVLFAAVHLHTYDWNVAQALMGVGVARIVLLIPYIITKNIWVSTGAHILNDWIMFGVSILAASGAASAGG